MIYLDYNATTPLDREVFEAMRPFLFEAFGNASSRHDMGCRAATAVEAARAEAAAAIGADPREIVWTSGATESNNLAILGVAESPIASRTGGHVVTIRTEHPAVLDPIRELQRRGHAATILPVDGEGAVDLAALNAAITEETRLVSVMHANNETGALAPIREIARIAHGKGALFHTDATQSFGKLAIDVEEDGIDLLSFSAHKLYGPKGVGGLYVRRRSPRVRLGARQFGGGHERGVRSGTLNVPGIVGLGAATRIAVARRAEEMPRIRAQRDRLEAALLALEGVARNGPAANRLAHTTNLSFGELDARELMKCMPDLCVSTASACTSAALQPSHVLGAMGLEDARIGSSLRFSLGRFTTDEEIERAAAMVRSAVGGE